MVHFVVCVYAAAASSFVSFYLAQQRQYKIQPTKAPQLSSHWTHTEQKHNIKVSQKKSS